MIIWRALGLVHVASARVADFAALIAEALALALLALPAFDGALAASQLAWRGSPGPP